MLPTIAPTWKQHIAWERLKDNVTEFVVFGGGAGGGKSWLGCEYLLTNCFFYPGTRYFIGRSELKQIRQSTVVSMSKVLRFHGIRPESLFKYNGQDNYYQFHNGSRIDLIEMKHYPTDPLYERWGSFEFTQGWIEEGGETEEDAMLMISSRTGRCLNDQYGLLGKTYITCNPKKNWLYYTFYQPWKANKLEENKAFIQALVDDNDKGETQYKKKLQGMKGIQRKRLLEGIWEYDSDPAALIETDAINNILRKPFEWNARPKDGKRYITVDVARFGKDSTVIALWYGHHVRLYRYINFSTAQTAEKIRSFMQLHTVPIYRVCIDADGIGGGVVDQLPGCRQFVNNATPFPNPINAVLNKDETKVVPENYDHLKSQCGFRTAEKINNGIITVEIMNTGLETDEHEEKLLREELEQVKQKEVDTDKKLGLLPKDEVKKLIGRSPDYWDSILMREYFELEPQIEVWGF